MVHQCRVCKKTSRNFPKLSFHRLPANAERRKEWVDALQLKGPLPKYVEVCADHFLPTDYYISSGKKYLRKNANPSLLLFRAEPVAMKITQAVNKELSGDTLSNIESLPSDDGSLSGVEALPDASQDLNRIEFNSLPGSSGTTFGRTDKGQGSLVEDPKQSQTDSSSSTSTAPSTQAQLMEMLRENQISFSTDVVGTSSNFRGPLKLIEVGQKSKRKHYAGDLESSDFETPRKRSKNLKIMKTALATNQRKRHYLKSTIRRLRLRITNRDSLIRYFREKSMISESSEPVIKASLDGPAGDIFNRMLKGPNSQKYDARLRSFALTLAFYSPRAYTFVRNTFNKSLPHPATISKWYMSVDGKPGFTKEALVALKLRRENTNKTLLCNLVMDEMAIRRRVEWNGTRFTGYVDIGGNVDSDELPEAKEALVFMLVCLNENWKLPVGYFLSNGVTAAEKATLVNRCLEFLSESSIVVTSLTFDGAASNVSMAEKLGADFSDPKSIKSSFKHPVTQDDVYIFYDPCHMIKLVRNCFASMKTLKNGNGDEISWEYITKLVEKQNLEGLHAATKVRLRHLQWAREKMRVRLATQTLSKSVADALTFLCLDLKDPEFSGSSATAEFILKFNNVFDIFNSRTRLAKYYFKRPLSNASEIEFFHYLSEVQNYILGLKLGNVSILKSQRKTGFLGFLICIESLKNMYQTYVTDKQFLKYLTTYRLSQDHIELFFGAIRSKGGFNNNPTARQFEAAYKRLIVKSEISAPDSGNVINLTEIVILTCSSGSLTKSENGENLQETESVISLEKEIEKNISDYSYFNSSVWDLTTFVEDIVGYISGFVVRKLKACVTCLKCLQLLESRDVLSNLQTRKTFGRLQKASLFVVDICKNAEKFFRFFLKTTDIFNKKIKKLNDILVLNTLKNLPSSSLDWFGDHLFDDDILSNHGPELIKLALTNYFKIRIHYETFKKLETSQKPRVRSLLTKTVLFRNE